MKTQELRNTSDEDLGTQLEQLRREVFQLRGQKLDGKSQQTHRIGEKRKSIARILTIKRERELRGKHE